MSKMSALIFLMEVMDCVLRSVRKNPDVVDPAEGSSGLNTEERLGVTL